MVPFDVLADPEPASSPVLIVAIVIVVLLVAGTILYFAKRSK